MEVCKRFAGDGAIAGRFELPTRTRRPVVSDSDKTATLVGQEIDLQDIARCSAPHHKVVELHLKGEETGVVDKTDIDAAPVISVMVGSGVVTSQRTQRLHQQVHNKFVLNFTYTQHIWPAPVVHLGNDRSQAVDLAVQFGLRPAFDRFPQGAFELIAAPRRIFNIK